MYFNNHATGSAADNDTLFCFSSAPAGETPNQPEVTHAPTTPDTDPPAEEEGYWTVDPCLAINNKSDCKKNKKKSKGGCKWYNNRWTSNKGTCANSKFVSAYVEPE